MVVYASTIVRDALRQILGQQEAVEDADAVAEALVRDIQSELVVTPRSIDELVAHLADTLALAINTALQPEFSQEELAHRLH